MMRASPPSSFSRRLMMSSVINAASLTPMSTTYQESSVVQSHSSYLSSRALARSPVRRTMNSGTGFDFRQARQDRALAIGQRLDNARQFEAFQPLRVFQVDAAGIDLDRAVC